MNGVMFFCSQLVDRSIVPSIHRSLQLQRRSNPEIFPFYVKVSEGMLAAVEEINVC